jgi:sporulation protein YlmC with PRC-barrel domain
MLSMDTVASISGMDVVGPDGERIGRAGSVFLDDDSGRPEWLTIETGLFGMRENFVPADEVVVDGDVLRIPFDKDHVKDAPQVDPKDGHITENQEGLLYRYYELVQPTRSGFAGQTDEESFTSGFDTGRDTSRDPHVDITDDTAAGSSATRERVTAQPRLRRYVPSVTVISPGDIELRDERAEITERYDR